MATCGEWHRIAPTERGLVYTGQRIQPRAEAVFARAVHLHGGTRVGPGAIPQRDHAMVEHVGERGEGRVAGAFAFDGVFGQVQGQRAMRAEQAQ